MVATSRRSLTARFGSAMLAVVIGVPLLGCGTTAYEEALDATIKRLLNEEQMRATLAAERKRLEEEREARGEPQLTEEEVRQILTERLREAEEARERGEDLVPREATDKAADAEASDPAEEPPAAAEDDAAN